MRRGTKKGLLIGTGISLGMFTFTETLMYFGGNIKPSLLDIILLALYWLMFAPLLTGMYNKDELAKAQEASNQLEGEYEITYILKCTYHKQAFNSEDALDNMKPFMDLEEDEVNVVSYKANRVGEQ